MNWKARYEQMLANGFSGSMTLEINDKILAFHSTIKDIINIKGDTVIDYGCGAGKMTEFLVQLFGAKKYIGYDIVNCILTYCRKKFATNIVSFKNAKDKLGKADIIWCSFLLQHLKVDAVTVLKKFKKALKPMGKIYIINSMIKVTQPDYIGRDEKEHLDLFREAGLKGVMIGNFNSMGVFEVTK